MMTDTYGYVPISSALAARAEGLVRASGRKSFNPFMAIDWSEPFGDDRYYLPPRALPLYGTHLWQRMSDRERFAYSRHEAAALCGTGIWLENVLMRLVVDRLYDVHPLDPTLRYLLVEIGDECRHSSMFAEFVRRAGTPAYRPSFRIRLLGRVARSLLRGPSAFLAILAAEELLDAVNRDTMRDDSLHPVSREVARIHVVEEARHVSFARAFLEQEMPLLHPLRRALIRRLAPLTVGVIANAMVNPAIFSALGVVGGERVARINGYHREYVLDGLARLVTFLEHVEVITEATRPLWEEMGLARRDPERTHRRPVPGVVAPATPFWTQRRR